MYRTYISVMVSKIAYDLPELSAVTRIGHRRRNTVMLLQGSGKFKLIATVFFGALWHPHVANEPCFVSQNRCNRSLGEPVQEEVSRVQGKGPNVTVSVSEKMMV